MIGSRKGNEAKGLQTPGNGVQHLGRSLDRARRGQEHQLDLGTVIERFRQTEQAAREREDAQLCATLLAIRKAKNGVSELLRPRARAAVRILRLGERIHVTARVWYEGVGVSRLRKALESTITRRLGPAGHLTHFGRGHPKLERERLRLVGAQTLLPPLSGPWSPRRFGRRFDYLQQESAAGSDDQIALIGG